MKNPILLLLLFCINTFPQSKQSLQSEVGKYYEANYLMDFEKIIASSYPEMVKTIGHDVLLEKIEKYYENDEYRLREQLETLPFQYGSIKKIEGKSFCVVTFPNPIRYFFETQLSSETAAEKSAWLKQVNNTKDITFEPKRNSFNVKRMSTYVAVMDGTTSSEWKFFNFDDPNQLESFQAIFDQSLKKELGL